MLHIGKTVVRAIPEGARTRATAFARERRQDSAACHLDPEVIADLRLLLRPEVVALGDHLGRDLVSPWEY